MLPGYIIAPAFMVSVVDVPILLTVLLKFWKSGRTVATMFTLCYLFLVFFSSYFSCVNPRFLESCFSFLWFFFKHFENFCSNYSIIWKTFKDLTDPTKPNMIDTIQIKASGSNNEVYYWMCSENFRKYLKKHTVKKIILKYSKNHPS